MGKNFKTGFNDLTKKMVEGKPIFLSVLLRYQILRGGK
jgi:hypothetical protein